MIEFIKIPYSGKIKIVFYYLKTREEMEIMGSWKKRGIVVGNVCFVILTVLFALIWVDNIDIIIEKSPFVENSISLLALLIAGVSVMMVVTQLKDTRKIQEAEFIVNLNQAFVDNANYAKMYKKLEKDDKDDADPEITRIEISNYLTFFETIYLLVKRKQIQMETLDDLFAYRFFLAVHNETVQNMKLVNEPYNFRNIYYLEEIWMRYRKKRGFDIYREENNLSQACTKANKGNIYKDIMDNKGRNPKG